MPSLVVDCPGIIVGDWWLPPFILRTGECLCVHLPERIDAAPFVRSILELAVRSASRAIWAEPAIDHRWWLLRPYLTSRRSADWLAQHANITRAQALAFLTELDLDPEMRIAELAGTPRTLLGLAAAWAQNCDCVAFTSAGCDPRGLLKIASAVEHRLDQCACLHLSFPAKSNGRTNPGCFPVQSATCIEIAHRPLAAAS